MSVYETTAKRKDLRVGDTVKLMKKCKSREDGWPNSWNPAGMDKYVGKTGVIKQINFKGIQVEGFDRYGYPVTCLRRIKKGPAHAPKGEDVIKPIEEAPKPAEYKVGDMVVVSGDDVGFHAYEKGEVVEITAVRDYPNKSYRVKRVIDGRPQNMKDRHLAGLVPVAPQPAPVPKKKEGYDVGDEVVISGEDIGHHCFTEGEVVIITRLYGKDYGAKSLDGQFQYLGEKHISGLAGEPKVKKKAPRKKKGDVDVGDTVEITGCKYYEHNIPIGSLGIVKREDTGGDFLIESDNWKHAQILHPSDFKKVVK